MKTLVIEGNPREAAIAIAELVRQGVTFEARYSEGVTTIKFTGGF